MMTPTTQSKDKLHFVGRKFFFHVKRSSADNRAKSAELIKLFGGQIEHFLDHEVTYILTDVPKSEWPPYGTDPMLEKAVQYKVKPMHLKDLLLFCSHYIASQSSSEDDDETRALIKQLQQPFIKFEDIDGKFAPSTKEFVKWPELNLDVTVPVGKSFFEAATFTTTPHQSANNVCHPNNSAQLTQQAQSMRTTTANMHTNSVSTANNQPPLNTINPTNLPNNNNNNNNTAAQNNILVAQVNGVKNNTQLNSNHQHNNHIAHRGVRRRHSVYCEICSRKIEDTIENHIQNPKHIANIERVDWNEVNSVIDSLPSLSTLNMRRLTNLTPPNGIEHQEFVCLHKMDSVSQLFFNSIHT